MGPAFKCFICLVGVLVVMGTAEAVLTGVKTLPKSDNVFQSSSITISSHNNNPDPKLAEQMKNMFKKSDDAFKHQNELFKKQQEEFQKKMNADMEALKSPFNDDLFKF